MSNTFIKTIEFFNYDCEACVVHDTILELYNNPTFFIYNNIAKLNKMGGLRYPCKLFDDGSYIEAQDMEDNWIRIDVYDNNMNWCYNEIIK